MSSIIKEANREPEITRRGKLVDVANPKPEVRKNAENASDWPYHEEAAYLYRMAVLFKDRLIDPVWIKYSIQGNSVDLAGFEPAPSSVR